MTTVAPDIAPATEGQAAGTQTLKVRADGAHRVISAEETVARARRHFGPMGITRVANITGLDCLGIPVVMVCRPNSRSLTMSQGKGVTIDAARASGIMECIEQYHAERVTLPLKLGSWNDLRFSHSIVDVERLPRTVESKFGPDTSLLWTCGVDLFTSRTKWVPFELVHTNYTLPFPTGTGCFVLSSNGLASGNHELEAVVHGLCEVIERDAHCLFLHLSEDEQEKRRIDLSTLDDGICVDILGRYRAAGIDVGIWDITSDVGVATFRCVAVDADQQTLRAIPPMEGVGCHPVRGIALQRALTEAAQSRLTFIAGARDDILRTKYLSTQYDAVFDRVRRRLKHPGTGAFGQVPSELNQSLEGDLSLILERLRGVGIDEVVAMNLTKPEFGIPVVRVVVPGLETHIHVDGYVQGKRAMTVVHKRNALT